MITKIFINFSGHKLIILIIGELAEKSENANSLKINKRNEISHDMDFQNSIDDATAKQSKTKIPKRK